MCSVLDPLSVTQSAHCTSALSVSARTRGAHPQQDIRRVAQKIVKREASEGAIDHMTESLQQYSIPFTGYYAAPGNVIWCYPVLIKLAKRHDIDSDKCSLAMLMQSNSTTHLACMPTVTRSAKLMLKLQMRRLQASHLLV